MLGFMTTTLSRSIARILAWARIDKYPIEIVWAKLPAMDSPRAPMLPWMFGYSPNYFKSEIHWWDMPESDDNKPPWWSEPNKLVRNDYTSVKYVLIDRRYGSMKSVYRAVY